MRKAISSGMVLPKEDYMEKIKQYLIFAKESIDKMGGNRGKMSSQAGHGYLHSFFDSLDRFPKQAKAYRDSDHAYKITLLVPSVEDLQRLHEAYRNVCGVALIKDAGYTVFTEPTITCLGIGPLPDNLKGDDLKELRPFM